MKKKYTIGLNDLLNVIGVATLRGDKKFKQKLQAVVNEKIRIDVTKEDYEYIMKNYTE
jgi:hypothetical protein